MDKERVKLLLRCFRPDGADAGDADFADALNAAASDRDLGEWLAYERAFDSAFAKALSSVSPPADLREKILHASKTDFAGLPQAETLHDARMIGAVASIQAPPALRETVLASMDLSRRTHTARRGRRMWWRAAIPAAAAAGIALAFFLTRSPVTADSTLASAPAATVPVEVVQASFIRTFESPLPLYDTDAHPEEHGKLMQILEKKKLPCPKCLPPGLVGIKGLGCRELLIDGKRGSLVCFDEPENGRVHLVIFKRADVCGDLPAKNSPKFTQNGPWACARWMDEGHVFVLLSSAKMDKLASLF